MARCEIMLRTAKHTFHRGTELLALNKRIPSNKYRYDYYWNIFKTISFYKQPKNPLKNYSKIRDEIGENFFLHKTFEDHCFLSLSTCILYHQNLTVWVRTKWCTITQKGRRVEVIFSCSIFIYFLKNLDKLNSKSLFFSRISILIHFWK